ncbi:MAG: hypothetical protein PHQ43_11620 [Dehalococcoidales bacterium]|nr:hypothetical protein [Dehalococcoidales bacterium]
MRIYHGEVVDVLYWNELTEEEKKDFGWATEEDTFFRYQDNVYCLAEFTRLDGETIPGKWDGALADSYFSAVLVRVLDDRIAVAVCY